RWPAEGRAGTRSIHVFVRVASRRYRLSSLQRDAHKKRIYRGLAPAQQQQQQL
ncbi:hypothetical protein H4R99_007386, partial [Coemansia sp. RSA 1722]